MDPKDPDRQKIQLYKDEKHIHGTVPFLDIENEMPILESGAVCLYLADLYGKFVPQPETRKDYYNWVLYACSTLDEVLETLYIQWGETTPENQDKELISKAIDKFSLFANYFSKFLEGKTYICGNRFTAADCVIGYNIWWSSVMKEDNLIQNYPNIVKYLDTLKKRPAFQKVFQC
ncbi:hypothetical protein KUTeg_003157 [Tegillarca granosa]|uniref:Glutathione S-transferase n=1 Tax=Tegillarca granosa TaxID=220873 RepID=A0ABQ9FLA7_TEGGR|nr:hypothetical protein KUTeg_003157 [Tegillarca granosa]